MTDEGLAEMRARRIESLEAEVVSHKLRLRELTEANAERFEECQHLRDVARRFLRQRNKARADLEQQHADLVLAIASVAKYRDLCKRLVEDATDGITQGSDPDLIAEARELLGGE